MNDLILDENYLEENKYTISYDVTLIKKKITCIEANLFVKFPNLTKIELTGNFIQTLDSCLFNGLKNLRLLLFQENQIGELDASIFHGLEKLELIKFTSNNIKSLDSNIFQGLKSLKKIFFNLNEIKTLDVNIFSGLEKLEYMNFNYNFIENLDRLIFRGLSNLKTIKFWKNRLKNIDANLLHGLERLEFVDFGSMQIDMISPNQFHGLKNLKHIDFFENKLTKLDANQFRGLNYLELIQFGKNQIESLDKNIFKDLTNLQRICLYSNRLKDLPDSLLDGLIKLETIEIYNNPDLKDLPINKQMLSTTLSNLKKISFNSNIANDYDIFYRKDEQKKSSIDMFSFSSSIEKINTKFNRRYTFKSKIGSPSNNCILLVDDSDDTNNSRKAIKVIQDYKYFNQFSVIDNKEINLLKNLNNSNIIKYYDSFRFELNTYIVMEYCVGGDLKERIISQRQSKCAFTNTIIFKWFNEILSVLEYLCQKEVIHRDIKPANILLDSESTIKMADFGLSTIYSGDRLNEQKDISMTKEIGTLSYRSPEITRSLNYSFQTDIWSAGCVFYEIVKLKQAYEGESDYEILRKIVEQEPPKLDEDNVFRNIVDKMLVKDPMRRANTTSLIQELKSLQ